MTFLVPHEEFIEAKMEAEGTSRSQVMREALDFYIRFENEVKRLVNQRAREEVERLEAAKAETKGRRKMKEAA
jgi:hypothetical protein